MTLPDERYRSLIQTKQFLIELQRPSMTARVPKHIRHRANLLLKHWPGDYHLEKICEKLPSMFQKELEPLYGLVKQYDIAKNEKSE